MPLHSHIYPPQRPHGASKLPEPLQSWRLPLYYQLQNVIGVGSYGNVCTAIDKRNQKCVAIKRLHRVFEDLIDCKRILREIAILNRLDDISVVKLVDIVVPEDLLTFDELYIVLEVCDSDLKKLFKTDVFLTELHVKTLMYNLLVGVEYLHHAGIYHRDLKPANCLVNQDCTVKICDFGLSRAVGMNHMIQSIDENGKVTNTSVQLKRQQTGHVVTRWYRAPELILLYENYTEKIDVWSVGCIFAELFGMLKENCPRPGDRGPLFPGSSCFPLSPDHKHNKNRSTLNPMDTVGSKDQLNVIFNILGTPHPEDVDSLVAKDVARKYLLCFAERSGRGLKSKIPHISDDGLDLLSKMVELNPIKRISIRDAIEHRFFLGMNDEENTSLMKRHDGVLDTVFIPFEVENHLDERLLRKYFIIEIQNFHPEVIMPQILLEV